MTASRSIDADAHAALDELLAEYLKAVEAGQPPDRQALLVRHPDLADELAEFFAGLDQFDQLAAPLRAVRHSTDSSFHEGATVSRCPVDTVNDARKTTPYHPSPASTNSATSAAPSVAGGIPGYEILGVLGRGGMGVVYQARQVQLKRLVALKMIRAGDQADEAEVARFRVEAEAVARLQHPNIVQIYEVGEHRGQPFCSLEFVAGGTLAARLAGTPQPPREAAALARTLAQAMATAHAAGIVHRDLKPANVLLASGGRQSPGLGEVPGDSRPPLATPKITDFGLAKKIDEDIGQTRTGAIMGTPAYMAPEQASGSKDVGPPADVYALGAILYEMLTGRPPFKGASLLETLEQVRTREPVAVRLLQPKVPRDLETICLKCLHKEPKKRYLSAEELAEDLGRWLDGKPIQARRSRLWEHGYRWVRRNPVVAALLTLVVAVVVGGFAAVIWQLRQKEAALEFAEGSLYVQRVSLSDREMQAGNTDLAEVQLNLCPPALRHWEWHYLKRRCSANWVRLAGHTDQVRCTAYNPSGTRLASCGNDGLVRVWDSSTGKEVLALPHGGWVNAVAFHTNGREVASASDSGTVKVWDAETGRELRRFAYGFAALSLSPDGRLFALPQSNALTIRDLETGRVISTIVGKSHHDKALAFSPDGRLVATILDGALRIWNVASGTELHTLRTAVAHGSDNLAFSHDGRRLFVSQLERYPTLAIWDVATGQRVAESMSTPLTVKVAVVSPDGRSIATGGFEGAVKVRDSATGKYLRAMPTFDDPIVSLAFRPDSQGLAVGTGRQVWLKTWREAKAQGPTVVRNHHSAAAAVAFSPNGSRLASCGDDERVQVWDAQSEQVAVTFSSAAKGYSSVAYSRDGGRLLATGRDGAVYSWDAVTGRPGATLRVPDSELTEAAFSPSGERIVTGGSDRKVRVWDAVTGQEVLSSNGHDAAVWGVQFSPDGRRLASAGGDGIVRLWDAATGRETQQLHGHQSYVQSVAFHPRGQLLASASTDETVRLWDVASGKARGKMEGHIGPVRGLSFTPDGRRLASAGEDGVVRLWDVTTGQEAFRLPHSGKVRCVAFSPEGWRLATVSSEGAVTLWDATPLENP